MISGGRGNIVQVSGKTTGPIRKQLVINFMVHQEGAEGLGVAEKGVATGGGRYPFVGNFYQVMVQVVLLFGS